MSDITPGIRISLRGEDFLVINAHKQVVEVEGITELVKGIKFSFDLDLEDYDIVNPENTQLLADTSPNYRQTKLFIETTLRNSSLYNNSVEIADKAAIRGANFQFEPTIKALTLPKPRILIADAVGLGKTVQVGIFMAEMIRRGKGQKILVVTPKSVLAQFQQEIWSRFAIPLVRLDTEGIARIKANIPSNKNPFDYYDKVIVSVDTLKNNGKFKHYLEKIYWDVIAIDECHNIANDKSQRGSLAKFLSQRCEAMVLTSATPHNGKKENFANLMSLLDPTSIPYNRNFTPADIQPLYVRRFKKDIEDEVGDAFRERETRKIICSLFPEEETVLQLIWGFKKRTYAATRGDLSSHTLLFSISLFKAYMSSPKACLRTIERRLEKEIDDEEITELLRELKTKITTIIQQQRDAKYLALKQQLNTLNWKGLKKDERIIIFSERRDTLDELEEKLKQDFSLAEEAIKQFNGSMTDTQQQELIEDFSKENSSIRLFLSSDAGSQGVNLHYHCNRMFNYDIPWSIITLEQRNGRIDRFGQKKTPFIYYLISQSMDQGVQADIRILERLKEKEEEVYKSLGDAGSVFKLFDSAEEEKKVTEAIAKSNIDVLGAETQTEETDWLDVFGLSEQVADKQPSAVSFDPGFTSFYTDDFDYYQTLINEITDREETLRSRFNVDRVDKVIEITQDHELSTTGVLYDVPPEAFPTKKDVFKLTTQKIIVETAIENARRKKGDWPDFHLLYDLHPIARWMQFKLLARVDKGRALVARLRTQLPDQSAWFIFQGVSSNGQGKPILSKTFSIGRSFNGGSIGSMDSFSDFMTNYHLFDTLQTLEIPPSHIQQLQGMLPEAVKVARKLYHHHLEGELQDEIEQKLEIYQTKLQNWLQTSEKQIEFEFEMKAKGIHDAYKDRRKRDLYYVNEQMNRFYESFFHLENEPYLRLLAVFYNA